jgi:TonB family protein
MRCVSGQRVVVRLRVLATAALATALPLFVRAPLFAQAVPPAPATAESEATGSLTGVVRDSGGTGIAGATVAVVGTAVMTQTDEAGAFALYGVRRGPVRLQVRRLGFAPASVDAAVRAEGGAPVSVTLNGIAQRLTPVLVHGGSNAVVGGPLADFRRRRSLGIGHYFTRAEIDRRAAPRVTDMLRLVPGVRVREDDTGRTIVRMRGQSCPPLVWLDGLPLGGGDMDADFVPPRDIEAIEVYSGTSRVPSELLGPWHRGQCGVIVVWLRDGERAEPKRKRPAAGRAAPDTAAGRAVFMAEGVDEPALLDDVPLPLVYPESLYAARVRGSVVAEFVVDAGGRADTTTFGVVSSSHPLFSSAVRAAIGKALFRPARLGGRAVRQVVYLPVAFLLPGDLAADRGAP